jgi:hypothetical protein
MPVVCCQPRIAWRPRNWQIIRGGHGALNFDPRACRPLGTLRTFRSDLTLNALRPLNALWTFRTFRSCFSWNALNALRACGARCAWVTLWSLGTS